VKTDLSSPIAAILFDLDGTLVDTAPDMALALNRLRQEYHRPPLPFELIRPQVSNGAAAMIRLGFGLEAGQAGYAELRERFLQLYLSELYRNSRLFPGLAAVLDQLAQRGIRWGIVTNKPAFLTDPLIRLMGLPSAVTVSGDSLTLRKPNPAQLLYAAGYLRLPPEHCLYIGDHERDIIAGRAAGMPSLAVTWGYLDGERSPQTWGANAVIDHPQQILEWLS